MVLNDLVDSFCYSQKNAGLKGLIFISLWLYTLCLWLYSMAVFTGVSCDRCADNYHGNPLVPGGTCERCMCNHNIDYNVPDSCDSETGECLKCLYHTEGYSCERCRPGYFGDATTQSCTGNNIINNNKSAQSNLGPLTSNRHHLS